MERVYLIMVETADGTKFPTVAFTDAKKAVELAERKNKIGSVKYTVETIPVLD